MSKGFGDNGFEAWGGYMQAKIAKLEEQYSNRAVSEALESNIFSGICIYVNGFTKPSADELKSLMARHGGVYHTYQRTDDFIIASNLPDTKVKRMSLSRVVKPEWITESIAAGHLLDYRNYLLYNSFRGQSKLPFENTSVKISSNSYSIKPLEITENSDSTIDSIKPLEITKNSDSLKPLEITENSDCNESKRLITKTCDTKTAVDPSFLSEFYNNSRLHHISQLSSTFKQYINNLRDKCDSRFPAVQILKTKYPNSIFVNRFDNGKVIMHIDMDCFFVSVGLVNHPELVGKPVAVTHSRGKQPLVKRAGVDRATEFNLYKKMQAKKLGNKMGVPVEEIMTDLKTRVDNIADENDRFGSMSEIASCSYEARAKGVNNGMFMGNALRLCPDLVTIPYDFEAYQKVAFSLYDTVAQYTLDIEAVSCDEMYVDCTMFLNSSNVSAEDFATELRQAIRLKTACPCSTGFGGNRLQARLATKKAKPDGQYFLYKDLVSGFMLDIKLKDLPGVGRQTAKKLESLGFITCGSLQNQPLHVLQQHLGKKTGQLLLEQCRGHDPNPLTFYNIRKSVSAEVNYGIRFENNDHCFKFLTQLSSEVEKRLIEVKLAGKSITLKLMIRAEDAPVETAKFMGHGFCNIINKSVALSKPTNDALTISKVVIEIYSKLNLDPKELRGIGIQVTKLEKEDVPESKNALQKYLCVKQEDKDFKDVRELNQFKEKQPQENNISKMKSSGNNSKTLLLKSPIKKRGRPPKLSCSAVLAQTSRSVISKFLEGNVQNDNIKVEPIKCSPNKNVTVLETESSFTHLSVDHLKELISAWLDSGQPPLACDILTITMHLKEMVLHKDLNNLTVLLKMLRRKSRNLNTAWTCASDEIIKQVQSAMLAVYGKLLYF